MVPVFLHVRQAPRWLRTTTHKRQPRRGAACDCLQGNVSLPPSSVGALSPKISTFPGQHTDHCNFNISITSLAAPRGQHEKWEVVRSTVISAHALGASAVFHHRWKEPAESDSSKPSRCTNTFRSTVFGGHQPQS